MSADNKSPFGFVTLGAAGLIALAVAASARAEVAGSPAAASSQSAAERPAAPAPACNAPTELTRLVHPLTRTGRRLASGAPLVIVAVGSSSTYGAGASSPAASYPSRLAVELRSDMDAFDDCSQRGAHGADVHEATLDAHPCTSRGGHRAKACQPSHIHASANRYLPTRLVPARVTTAPRPGGPPLLSTATI